MILIHLLVVLTKIIHAHRTYDKICPSVSQWNLRGKGICNESEPEYLCLYDDINKQYTESCRLQPEFEREGYFIIVRGDITSMKCNAGQYQPYTFTTHGNTKCLLSKSTCSGVGQIAYDNGTITSDRKCRCDFTQGYDFVRKPKHTCFCIPSEEDCSCYLKKCSANTYLTPDYDCLPVSDFLINFKCPLHTSVFSSPKNKRKNILATIKEPSPYLNDKSYGLTILTVFITVVLLFTNSVITAIIIIELQRNLTDETTENTSQKINIDRRIIVPTASMTFHSTDETTEYTSQKINIDRRITVPDDSMTLLSTEITEQFIQHWQRSDENTVGCRPINVLLKNIEHQNVVFIHGPPVSGKTTILQHIALRLQNKFGYKVLKASCPLDIYKQHSNSRREVFVVDDIYGIFAFDPFLFDQWVKFAFMTDQILVESQVKILTASRSSILERVRGRPDYFMNYQFNLMSPELALSEDERKRISFQKEETLSILYPITVSDYLLKFQVKQLKELLKSVVEEPLIDLIFALFVISDNYLTEGVYNSPKIESFARYFKKESCNTPVSWKEIKEKLDYLAVKSIVSYSGTAYVIKHNIVFDILVPFVGNRIFEPLLESASPRLVRERFRFESVEENMNEEYITISLEKEQLYFDRLVKDIHSGYMEYVFANELVQFKTFNTKLIRHLQGNKEVLTRIKEIGVKNKSPLLMTTCQGLTDIVRWLVNLVEVNIIDDAGRSPIYIATEYNYIEIVKILLDKGGDCNLCRTDSGHERESPLFLASLKSNVDIVKLLLEHGACPNITNIKGLSPLHCAASSGYNEIAALLLQFNANCNLCDFDNNSPLHEASKNGFQIIVELLLQHGSDYNKLNDDGKSPLHIAVSKGFKDIVKLFMGKKADPDIYDSMKMTPLYMASESGFFHIVEILLMYHADPNKSVMSSRFALLAACEKGHLDIVEILLKNRANPNMSSGWNLSPLYVATREGHTKIVEILLSNGADVNVRCLQSNMSPLHFACLKGYVDIVQILLVHECNVNIYDFSEITPLYIACREGHSSIVSLLLTHNANPNIQCDTKGTPLYIASMQGHLEIVYDLLKHDANPNLATSDHETAMSIALKGRHTEIVDLLEKYGGYLQLSVEKRKWWQFWKK